MLGKLARLVTGAGSDQAETWREWQRSRPPAHFQLSPSYQTFVSYYPDFVGVTQEGAEGIYATYCLGQFRVFAPSHWIGAVTRDRLLRGLLHLYDSCKGVGRSLLWGDPPGVLALRRALEEGMSSKAVDSLFLYDFSSSFYDYTTLHAHTVAYFSLSTLVLSLASHILSRTVNFCTIPYFEPRLCKKAFESKVFGLRQHEESRSVPVAVPASPPPAEIAHGSWPNGLIAVHTCRFCHRKTEKLWGDNQACLDCHMEKICALCSTPASTRGGDGFPRCALHALV